MPSFADVVARALPAVVNITVVTSPSAEMGAAQNDSGIMQEEGKRQLTPFDQLLRRFFEPYSDQSPSSQLTAQGSGFIVDPAGFIVSSMHVVEGAREVTVVLQDNARYPATIVGTDEASDLALLKIDAPRPLPSVVWGDSNTVLVGDWILAVGNPFGLGGTVSAGILSARGRDINAGPYDNFLQIDAPLNRGNSGGPTFNSAGEVIGINTAIYTPSGGSVGIGFAIPSSDARPVIEQLRTRGRVIRGWLGVSTQDLTPELATGFGLSGAEGVLICEIMPGGPAERAGLRQGDIVLAFNGVAMKQPRDLSLAVARAPIGRNAAITLWRDGRRITLRSDILEAPAASAVQVATSREEQGVSNLLGLRFEVVNDDIRRDLGLGISLKGILVLDVTDDSPFADAGLDRGDVIEEIDHHAVTTAQRAAVLLRDAAAIPGRSIVMLINREGRSRFIAFLPAGNGSTE